jgi:uncharacterized damage-inducible protein DinB
MRLREYATTMAAYNAWMNEQICDCAATLDDEARKSTIRTRHSRPVRIEPELELR